MWFEDADGVFSFGEKLDNKKSNSHADKTQGPVIGKNIQVQHHELAVGDRDVRI
jgi:hypothetical protein